MIYRAMWEIVDDRRTRSQLIVEACGLLDAMAAKDGARITGDPVWTITEGRLVCEVEAVETEPVEVEQPARPVETIDAAVLRYNEMGWSNRQIARVLDTDAKTVGRCLARYGRRSPHPPHWRRTALLAPVEES